MQDSAYRAKITIPETTKIMEAGSRKVLAVKVRNVSDSTWLSWADSHGKSNIHLGNHWLSPARKLLTHHDGRAALPRSLYPQMEVELQLTVKAPDEPGDYVMVLDMVLEGVTWFYDKGSEMTELQVHVTEGAAPASVTKPEPAMEMHSIPKSEVLELIRANGGRVLDVQPDYNAPGWMGYRYCVTK